ncbi:hypothetical protein WJX77_003506 [Trebouxia sp. C0004]
MSFQAQRSRPEQIERIVSRLAEDVHSAVGGRAFPAKLIQTAVTVLSNDKAVSSEKWERDVHAARSGLSHTAADGTQLEQRVQELGNKGTPLVEELLIVLHSIQMSANTKQALSARAQSGGTTASALHTPSTIHNQLAQLRDVPSQKQTPALPARAVAPRHAHIHAKKDDGSHASSSGPAPTPLSRSALQSIERQSAASSLKRQPPSPRSLPVANSGEQHSLSSPTQTEYRNPVFGQEEGFSPVKSGPAYAPVLTNALPARGLSPLGPSAPAARAVGDLFRPPGGSLPNVAVPNCPALPDWNQQRPYLTGQYLMESLEVEQPSTSRQQPLESFSPAVQEIVVLEDMLWGFMGFEGKYIKVNRARSSKGGVSFVMTGKLDAAVHELITRMLPICEHVVVIQRFVETRSAYEWGLACHAAAAAMRSVLQDWNLMVTQLEHQLRTGRLTLQALWYYCQPPLASLQLLAAISSQAAVGKLRGSALLNLLHQRSHAVAGDDQARRLLQKLLHAACTPYFRMLERWLCEGIVHDPYEEFMIQEHKDISKDSVNKEDQSAYWYHRYSLRPLLDAQGHVSLTPTGAAVHDVPLILAEAKDSILMTGKYLNAIRECGRQVVRPLPPHVHIEYSSSSGSYMQNIQAAFATSSQALLHLLQHDLGLNNTLAALKHYFLLDKGDMLLSFLDTAEEELSKPASEVSVIRLQSLLDLAVRSSSAASDPTTEKLECFLDHRSLLGMLQQRAPLQEDSTALQDPRHPLVSPRQMPSSDPALLRSRLGREAFLLGYKIEWPLSIVISQQAMTQYQLIFRHLFELKYVERQLVGVWQLLQPTRGLFRWGSESLKRCYSLCQHMMHFFHQYLLYVTFEVLEPLWHTMSSQCRTANTLDEVIGHHTDFLRKVLKGCLLSRKLTLLQSLVHLKKQAAVFTQLTAALQIQPESESTSDLDIVPAGDKAQRRRNDRKEKAASTAALLQHVIGDPKFGKAVQELENSFGAKFSDFITELQEMHQTAQSDAKESREELDSLSNLIGRLDFNDFFKPKPDYRAMLAQGAI